MDALKYGVGAVLLQEGGAGHSTPRKRHPIAFYLATFSPTEQNYNAYDLEFLGVLKSIKHWCPYLIWTKEPFIIKMDHKNLTYWKSLWKLTGWTVQWHEKLQDYNFKILHISEKNNTPADMLSWPNSNKWETQDRQLLLIPPQAFLNIADVDSVNSLETAIVDSQQWHAAWMKEAAHQLNEERGLWTNNDGREAVPPDQELKRQIMHAYHDGLVAHLGCNKMVWKVL